MAEVPGFPGVRFAADGSAERFARSVAEIRAQLRARLAARRGNGPPTLNILALSGGAQNGAFGAGLIVGWQERGSFPDFDLVTGVSAGALIAPLAFLGGEYRHELSKVFTRPFPKKADGEGGFAAFIAGADTPTTSVLEKLIARHIDDTLLDAIARERRRGRFLLVGTTNIETQQPIFWDMGRIAASDHPDRGKLFRKILLASASIPGLFDPVYIGVEANGRTFDEIHIDGGTTKGAFIGPIAFTAARANAVLGERISRRVFIIRNGKVNAEYEAVDNSFLPVAGRAISTLIKYRGNGDLYRIYARAQRDSIDYNLAFIPPDYVSSNGASFNLEFLRELFSYGRSLGRLGYDWHKAPPGFEGPGAGSRLPD